MKKTSQQPKRQKSEGKKKYKVRNWREYNEALVNRGKITLWVSEETLREWLEKQKTGKRGKPKFFSNTAIETTLTIREVFHLPLRQTEGFLVNIFRLMGVLAPVPDYSTLSKRSETLSVAIRVRPMGHEPMHLVVDSSGIKVFGEGEWKVRAHGWSKHRTWRKIHLGVDEATNDILLGEVTGNDAADCELLAPLFAQLPESAEVAQVSADGAYDKRACYETLQRRRVPVIAIPPQRNARIFRHGNTNAPPYPRDENLRRIRKIGRKKWKEESGYHRRSIAENAVFRLKTIFTDKVRSVTLANQRMQLLLRCKALNRMNLLGMPESYVVA
jgi:hypothetical protein